MAQQNRIGRCVVEGKRRDGAGDATGGSAHGLRRVSVAAMCVLVCLAAAASAVSVARAASNVVQYTYDAAGNIVAMRRGDPAAFGISGFAPSSGPMGTVVTISGNGFPPAGAGTVAFNGASATVLSATSTTITASVPSGATTGRISVIAAGKTAVSAEDFVVTLPGAPTVLDFAPPAGPAGTAVTVRGTNFNPATGATTVRLNQSVATLSAITPTQLTFAVQAQTGSGKIRIATSAGAALSSTDFVVPPATVAASDIIAMARLAANGPSQSVAIFTRNKFGLLLFDASPGDWLSVQFDSFAINPAASSISYAIYRPDNTQLASGTLSSASLTIHVPPLVTAGTYSVLLASVNAQLSLSAKLETNSLVPADGAPLAVGRGAGQSTRALIAAVAGEQKALMVSGLSTVPAGARLDYLIALPNGSAFRSGSAFGLGSTALLPPFTTTGTHPITLTPLTVSQTAFKVAMLAGTTLAVDGPSLGFAIANPGEAVRANFVGTAGDNLGLGVTGLTLDPASAIATSFTVYKPDATALATSSCSITGTNCSANLTNLPVSGNYSVIVQPLYGATATLNLWLSRDVTGSLSNGVPSQIVLSRPGQNARLAFTGTAGALAAIQVRNISTVPPGQGIFEQILVPTGSAFAGTHLTGIGQTFVPPSLPVDGTYTVFLEPESTAMGAATAKMEVLLDPGQSLLVDGPPVQATSNVSSGSARFSFVGVAGQNLGFGLGNLALNPVSDASVFVYRPDGTSIVPIGCPVSVGRCGVNLANLPATGAYAIVIRPATGATGSFVGTLSSDLPGTLPVGGSLPVSLDRTGRNARLTFAGTAGQALRLAWSGVAVDSTYAVASVTVYQPNGATLATVQLAGGVAGGLDLPPLPLAGTYTIFVDPFSGATMSATFSLTAR